MIRKLISLLILFSLVSQAQIVVKRVPIYPAGGGGSTFTFTQFKSWDELGNGTGGGTCSSGTQSCVVNMAAPGAGHLLVAVYIYGAGSHINIAPTGGQTWTNCASCAQGDSTNGFIDVYYVLSATATGQTTLTCNWSVNTGAFQSCLVFEYSWSGTSISLDTQGGAVRASCSTCAAVTLSLTGTDVVIQAAVSIPAGTGITALSDATFNSPTDQNYSNVGAAGKINVASFTAPNWTVSPSTATSVMGVAFKGN